MLAARHKLPAVYFDRFFATGGGLISYGPNSLELHRQAAGFGTCDRLLERLMKVHGETRDDLFKKEK